MKDLKNRLGVVHLLDPQDVAGADTTTKILDVAGFNAAVLAVSVGTLTGVDGSNYLTAKLQESNTGATGSFTDVAAGEMHGAFVKIDATSEDQTSQVVGYKGSMRYLRVKLDFTGTVSAALVSVVGVLGRPNVLPAVAPDAIAAVAS